MYKLNNSHVNYYMCGTVLQMLMITVQYLTFSSHFMKMSSHFHFARTCFTFTIGIEIMSSMA